MNGCKNKKGTKYLVPFNKLPDTLENLEGNLLTIFYNFSNILSIYFRHFSTFMFSFHYYYFFIGSSKDGGFISILVSWS